jgi:hypothetical protein
VKTNQFCLSDNDCTDIGGDQSRSTKKLHRFLAAAVIGDLESLLEFGFPTLAGAVE